MNSTHYSIKFDLVNWAILLTLGAVWGSSFILMKIGSTELNSLEIAAIRNGIVGIFVLPNFVYIYRKVPKRIHLIAIAASLLGNGIPSIFYAYAARYIDSNVNGVINSLTPIFTLLFGILIFGYRVSRWSILGVVVGFVGVFILFFSKGINAQNIWIAILPLISTMMYGLNTNIIKLYLSHLRPFDMLSLVFGYLFVPASLFVLFSDVLFPISMSEFSLKFWEHSPTFSGQYTHAFTAILILGIVNSFASSLLFYFFIKRTTAIFAAMTTYLIPIMSIFWGYIDHEPIGWLNLVSIITILSGVLLVNRRK